MPFLELFARTDADCATIMQTAKDFILDKDIALAAAVGRPLKNLPEFSCTEIIEAAALDDWIVLLASGGSEAARWQKKLRPFPSECTGAEPCSIARPCSARSLRLTLRYAQ
ncbi:hypothetical protein GUJ93_ZPchr0001g32061 [Zizania palustris]|uniref:Uncharacterized protein n=1 Tax=Zizania palustris TaxID=103762 RepID=A0A8J5VDM1_ZIZPA|nr:hypothetical protein GUJ93_ZPchr0001g32061 [Zizania palustris]